jgi:ankyrin repeat protein
VLRSFVAAILLASIGRASAQEATKTIRWTVGAKPHGLTVGEAVDSDEVGMYLRIPGSRTHEEIPDDRPGASWSSEQTLLSVVGPMVSRFHEGGGYFGSGGHVDQWVEVELLDGYRFKMSALLRKAGVHLPEEPKEIDRFWIVAWDGRAVTLGLQTHGCVGTRSTCRMGSRRITVTPPDEWIPWLEAARRGRGLLQADAARFWRELSPEALDAARAKLASLSGSSARRAFLRDVVSAREHAPASAARLLAESFAFATAPFDKLETQGAWADRLDYLAAAFPDDTNGKWECARTIASVIDRSWRRATGARALRASRACLQRLALSVDKSPVSRDKLLVGCVRARDPMSCARERLHDYLRAFAHDALVAGAWTSLADFQALVALAPAEGSQGVALGAAASHGDDAAVDWMLGRASFSETTLENALYDAAGAGDLALVDKLVARGAKLDPFRMAETALSAGRIELARRHFPTTPLDPRDREILLQRAIEPESTDALELVLARVGDLSKLPANTELLREAVNQGRWRHARLLLEHQIPSNRALESDEAGAACGDADTAVVRTFLDRGLAISADCVHRAVLAGRLDVVADLAAHGADLDAPPPWGWSSHTPLQTAIEARDVEMIELLLRKGAKLGSALDFVKQELRDNPDDEAVLNRIREGLVARGAR